VTDLFSFLDPSDEDYTLAKATPPPEQNASLILFGRRRKEDAAVIPNETHENITWWWRTKKVDEQYEARPSLPQKPQLASSELVVPDDFETEAKREVAASARLTGIVEARTRLELRPRILLSSLLLIL
jgi:hypothetical protein